MFDVSNNLIYYLDEKPLSALELRNACASGRIEEIQVSQEASHNGEYLSKEEALGYQLKNLVYLRKMIHNDEEHEINKETDHLWVVNFFVQVILLLCNSCQRPCFYNQGSVMIFPGGS